MKNFGRPWVALALALALHVADEAAHDFLGWYNPSVLAMRERAPWLPLPTFGFAEWVAGLAAAVLLLLSLSPLAYAGNRALRVLAIGLGLLMTANGAAHLTVSLWNGRFMPGVLSSPFLMAASIWLLTGVRHDRPIFPHFWAGVMRSRSMATARSRLSRRWSLRWILGSSRRWRVAINAWRIPGRR